MIRSFIVFGVVILFSINAGAGEKNPPPGWKAVSGGFKKEAYTVWLPANGTIDEKESSIVSPKFGQIRVFRTVCATRDGALYGAGQINLPPTLVKETPKFRQDLFRDLFLDEVNGKLLEESNAKLDVMAGKEYLIKTPRGMARYRLLGTGVQIFRIFVIGSKEHVLGKEADQFFASFKRNVPRDPEVVAKPGPGDSKPNPNTPAPEAKGFTKPANATAAVSYFKIVSPPGDYIGQGKTYDYKGEQLTLKAVPRGVSVRVDGWSLSIGAPKGQSLKVGEYRDAKRFAFSGDSPGLDFSGNGRGSNKLTGEFVVWELEMTDGQIVRVAIDFVQRSEGGPAALTGKLRVNSNFE